MEKQAEIYQKAYEMQMRENERILEVVSRLLHEMQVIHAQSDIDIEQLFMESDALDDDSQMK